MLLKAFREVKLRNFKMNLSDVLDTFMKDETFHLATEDEADWGR
jgi:hypothetical protein